MAALAYTSFSELLSLNDTKLGDTIVNYHEIVQVVRSGFLSSSDAAPLLLCIERMEQYITDFSILDFKADMEAGNAGEEEIQQMEILRQDARKQLSKIQHRLPLYKSLLAPVRRLPNELLLNIFSYVMSSHELLLSDLHVPAFSLVCHRWSNIFYTSAQLWRTFVIDEPATIHRSQVTPAGHAVALPYDPIHTRMMDILAGKRTRLVQDVLQRTGRTLLSLEIRSRSFHPSDGFRQDNSTKLLLSQSHRLESLTLRNVLLDNIDSCVSAIHQGVYDPTSGSPYHFNGWPNLRSLELNSCRLSSSTPLPLFSNSPVLERLVIGRFPNDNDISERLLPLSQIRQLSMSANADRFDTIQFIARMPNLMTLEVQLEQSGIRRLPEPSDPTPIPVKYLQLSLGKCEDKTFVQTTFHLRTTMTSLIELSVVGVGRLRDNHLYGVGIRIKDHSLTTLVKPSSLSLTSLVLDNLDIDESCLIELLKTATAVREFTYKQASYSHLQKAQHQDFDISEKLLSWLTVSPWAQANVLPDLRLLNLRVCAHTFHPDNMAKMVGSRWDPSGADLTRCLESFRLSVFDRAFSKEAYSMFEAMKKGGLNVSIIDIDGAQV